MTSGASNHIRPMPHKSGAPMYVGNSTVVKPIKTLISQVETKFKMLNISTVQKTEYKNFMQVN